MGNNSVPKFIFRFSRFPIYRGSVLGRLYCTRSHAQRGGSLRSWVLILCLTAFQQRKLSIRIPQYNFWIFSSLKYRCPKQCSLGPGGNYTYKLGAQFLARWLQEGSAKRLYSVSVLLAKVLHRAKKQHWWCLLNEFTSVQYLNATVCLRQVSCLMDRSTLIPLRYREI